MKNIDDVLRQKETELQQIQSEINALHIAMRLMSEDGETRGRQFQSTGTEGRVQEIKSGPAVSRQFP